MIIPKGPENHKQNLYYGLLRNSNKNSYASLEDNKIIYVHKNNKSESVIAPNSKYEIIDVAKNNDIGAPKKNNTPFNKVKKNTILRLLRTIIKISMFQ